MKAIVYREYGSPDVLNYEEIDKPSPKDEEVFVRVHAASLNPLDWHYLRGMPWVMRFAGGLRRPKRSRLGVDMAGEVAAVGRKTTELKTGDAVFGAGHGAFAEYVCASRSMLAIKPDKVTFEQAASIPIAGLTALQALRDRGQVQPGKKVLINGAAGGVGTFAVQIAKWLGGEVTGVCSTRNVEMVRSLGADHVIDYTNEDFTRNAERYDVMLDNVGNHSLSACSRVLNAKGKYILIGGGGPDDRGLLGPGLTRAITAPLFSLLVGRDMRFFLANLNNKDLDTLGELVATGKVTPVIDRRYRLNEIADAVRYLEEGHARGKVIVTP